MPAIRSARYPISAPPEWARNGRPVLGKDRLAVERMSDGALTGKLRAAGVSEFVARITVEDRRSTGALYRIVHTLRRSGAM